MHIADMFSCVPWDLHVLSCEAALQPTDPQSLLLYGLIASTIRKDGKDAALAFAGLPNVAVSPPLQSWGPST